jgi:hypothetical protein
MFIPTIRALFLARTISGLGQMSELVRAVDGTTEGVSTVSCTLHGQRV